jgi:hypothetical protein
MRLPKARLLIPSMLSLLLSAVLIGSMSLTTRTTVRAQTGMTEETIYEWITKYSNWGRWGADDERGTNNFITPKVTRHAAQLVKLGITVPTARSPYLISFDPTQPGQFAPQGRPSLAPLPTEPLAVDESNPFYVWWNPTSFTSDRWNFAAAGATHTHLDAMCHTALAASTVARGMFSERLHYNGIPLLTNNTADGCMKLGIDVVSNGIATRGVLLDATLIPEIREPGYPWVAPGQGVTMEMLERLEDIQKVRVRSGDVLLLYTGRFARRDALGPWPTGCAPGVTPPACGMVGFHPDTVPFFYEREIAHFGNDSWNDMTPSPFPGFASLFYHGFQATLGITHFDNMDLEKLIQTARQLNRYEFFFTTGPFPVEGGATSIVNPIAIF